MNGHLKRPMLRNKHTQSNSNVFLGGYKLNSIQLVILQDVWDQKDGKSTYRSYFCSHHTISTNLVILIKNDPARNNQNAILSDFKGSNHHLVC